MGREKLIKLVGDYSYEKGICPVAEMLQPQLLQFKTNYFDTDLVDAQAEILKKTIAFFNK